MLTLHQHIVTGSSPRTNSSQLYHSFDQILLLAHGHALYSGPGGFAPAEHFTARGIPYKEGYNVADYLLEVASDPPVALFQLSSTGTNSGLHSGVAGSSTDEVEKGLIGRSPNLTLENGKIEGMQESKKQPWYRSWFQLRK